MAILAVAVVMMFMADNAEFIQDMNEKLEYDCTFTYTGKQPVRPNVPHIDVEGYVYFSMEPCDG